MKSFKSYVYEALNDADKIANEIKKWYDKKKSFCDTETGLYDTINDFAKKFDVDVTVKFAKTNNGVDERCIELKSDKACYRIRVDNDYVDGESEFCGIYVYGLKNGNSLHTNDNVTSYEKIDDFVEFFIKLKQGSF